MKQLTLTFSGQDLKYIKILDDYTDTFNQQTGLNLKPNKIAAGLVTKSLQTWLENN